MSLVLVETEKIVQQCIGEDLCGLCVKECEYLEKFCRSPRDLAERFGRGYFREKPHIPYSCSLCNLCEKVCPYNLNMGKVALELRRQLVAERLGPLPQHRFVKIDQKWNASDAVALALPSPNTGACEQVFFPGCILPTYSPSLVFKTYQYLNQRLPDTGIILGCCGAPTQMLGDEVSSTEILADLKSKLDRLGTAHMIVACPHCQRTIRRITPEIKVSSLYEVLLEIGLPEREERINATFSLHDPCTTRDEPGLQQSVRNLAHQLGCRIEEMDYSREKTRCCGLGGTIHFVDINLSRSMTRRRCAEASFDILTYCASCREALAQEKPSLHILDLIFNPNWKEDRLKPPTKPEERRKNQQQLKQELLSIAGG